jgi:hypothetical protein
MTAKSCKQDHGEQAARCKWSYAPSFTSELQHPTTVLGLQLYQKTRKQYLDAWLIGQINLFSTSYGRM